MKRLYRSQKNRVIAGVCGGVAEYLNIDPVLVRLIAILLLFVGGGSFIAYIIGIIVIPNEPPEFLKESEAAPVQVASPSNRAAIPAQAGSLIGGAILIILGLIFFLRNFPLFHRYCWWFWDMGWRFFWPSVLIFIGLLVVARAVRNHLQ
jgi:phage shock protein C